MKAVGKNGVLVLSSVTGGSHRVCIARRRLLTSSRCPFRPFPSIS